MSEPQSFWRARMPAVHNAIQGAKAAAERGDDEWVEANLDAADQQLEKAHDETGDAISKRDAGESRDNDPDVRDGVLW